ncbi:MAG TPA: peptide deformylase [Methylomirabilota bacterium]|jgi:peptide deformylase|nr:peptide deformylase [Methylomirabilota bacterium]
MIDLIDDDTLAPFAMSGPSEEIGDRIRERYRGLYDRTQLYPSFRRRSTTRTGARCWRGGSGTGLIGCATIRARGDPMAILKVARLGHPVLRQVAVPVPIAQIRSAETQRLIDDMVETMREYNGAGLAATQVHELKQICVIEVHGNPRYPDAPAIPLTVLVNPVVTPLTEEMEEGWEGCLSVPDMRGVVPRLTSVRLEAFDREGRLIDLVAKDFFARVIQHETDHLHGRVYLDRMRDLSTLTHLAEWNRYWLGNREQDD